MTLLKLIIPFLLLAVLFTSTQAAGQNQVVIIEGQVFERTSKTLLLMKMTEEPRYRGLEIPISDSGHFIHEMQRPEFMEEYELIFDDELQKGSWNPIYFYPESDTIRFELYPASSYEKNKVFGSEGQSRMNELYSSYTKTFESGFRSLNTAMDSLSRIANKSGMETITSKIDSLNKEVVQWQLAKFERTPDLFSYSRVLELTTYTSPDQIPVQRLNEVLDVFTAKYPDHPYTHIASNFQMGMRDLRIGGKYIDFTAVDSLGQEITISSLIEKNKFTLIDLWAPWCAPCIKKSKKIQDIFATIQPKGFDVVAVLGGIRDEQQYFNALKKYNYPWIVLMELKDKNRIWEKYNITRAGGSQFLVDQNGNVLAINPELEEFVQILEKS